MAKYKYTGGTDGDQYYQGLPLIDLDDADLTDEQLALLIIATQRGIYKTLNDLRKADMPDSSAALVAAAVTVAPKTWQADVEPDAGEVTESEDMTDGSTDDQPATDD